MRVALCLILAVAAPLAFAERNLYKIDDLNKAEFDLAEDKVFWDRALMEVSSHSMSMPTPRQDPCLLEVSISCELLDGTDCASFASMDCLVDVTYTYSFENVGPVPFDVARAEKQRQSVTTDLVPLLTTTELFPGETMNVLEIETIDFCVPSEILTILGGEGTATDGGLCDDAEINVIRTPGARRKRRLLRENDRG